MGDRSEAEAREAEIGRQFEAAKATERQGGALAGHDGSRSIMVEMGGFVFCSECITAAYGIVVGRKAGR